jgi:4-alpha-glucanotransferase
MDRVSGILLHPTSLWGPGETGRLGEEAYRFADWLAEAGQKIWQVLPLGPVGYGESPYAAFSAFAGDERLVSGAGGVGLGAGEQSEWLEEFATFMALKAANGGGPWWEWDPAVRADPREVERQKAVQAEFFRQWCALKRYCNQRGIKLMGDLPIYVAKDSADVWARPDLFRFDVVAGVPPDYFSATGQLWGNPIYRWDRMRENGYAWWVERMRASLTLFDRVRMDHFRGFEAYWEVPADEPTAVKGKWVKGPGAELFRVLLRELGELPIVAENLGVITPEVEAIREEFGLPGMAVLQFAFGKDPQGPSFQPHNYPRNLAAYTGTHDNDTVMGWWRSEGGDSTRTAEDVGFEKVKAATYLGIRDQGSGIRDFHWVMIRELMKSVADTVVFPMQDVLGLGSEARMNTPSTARGNWRWRMAGPPRQEDARRLREMVELYGRG